MLVDGMVYKFGVVVLVMDGGEYRTHVEWTPVDECPTNEHYVIRTMRKFEVRDGDGNVVRNLLKNGR
jgi:hypothetical protein|tara:strand:- start:993 stop:1193 length:201 start_codon:yes stop_codon:yes gene_type:complete